MNSTKIVALSALVIGAAIFAIPAQAQEKFKTPQAAAQALIAAGKKNDVAALQKIFGKGHEALAQDDADPSVADRRKRLLDASDKLILYREDDKDQVTLVIGDEGYPFPVPLVRKGGAWQFDAEQGEEEIINRRVGANELATISVMQDLVKAQFEYASAARDGSGVRQFATRFLSTAGKRDGLYWETGKDEVPSPAGPIAAAKGEAHPGAPYYGYAYKILTRQGEHAPGGAYDYMINGRLIAGFAVLAYPAAYGDTGVTSFLVNQYGDVYQSDLGDDTEAKAGAMTAYDLGEGWVPVSEASEQTTASK